MSNQQDFEAAAERVKSLSSRPDNQTLLKLYALYKQGTEGDVSGKRPSRLNIQGRAKYDAWKAQEGTDQGEARQAYIDLVDKLVGEDD